MRIVRLKPGPLDPGVLEELRARPVFLLDGDPVVERGLREAGIPFSVASEEISGNGVLVVPCRPLDALAGVTDRLLGPGGCPWDQAQTHESLKKYLLEEAYEVLDAIDSGSIEDFREELGDLLLQPVLHAQMCKRDGEFDIDDVARGITEKLIRRHPHVFGDVSVEDADEVLKNWDQIKRQEKGDQPRSTLAGIPKGMASLLRAHEISKRAVRVGFEWPNLESVFEKLHEEEAELKQAIGSGDREAIESEVGDLLFTAVNIARWVKVEPEEALRKMLNRFSDRFMYMESVSEKPLDQLTAEEWDDLWNRAKYESRNE